jgi:hypothetical protein
VDPNGKPFLSKGVDVVSPYGDTGTDKSHIFNDAVQAKYPLTVLFFITYLQFF